tara:strand:+ start:4567 stop:5091 length:525 start_codon:yes stop_codon:yes gene_type:complete
MKKIESYKTPCNSMYKPYSIMELRNRTLPNVTSKITELVLEPYIAVPKVDFVRLDIIEPGRIKEIVYSDCENKKIRAYLCYKYPLTEHGYKRTRALIEKTKNKCIKFEISSFSAACDMASYGYSVQYGQYIQRYIKGDREDLEDLHAVYKMDSHFYKDTDHFGVECDYLLNCYY